MLESSGIYDSGVSVAVSSGSLAGVGQLDSPGSREGFESFLFQVEPLVHLGQDLPGQYRELDGALVPGFEPLQRFGEVVLASARQLIDPNEDDPL